MENQWCKILIINNQQVLVMTDYDEDDEVYQILMIANIDSIKSEFKLGFKNQKSRDLEFQNEKVMEEVATNFFNAFTKMIGEA